MSEDGAWRTDVFSPWLSLGWPMSNASCSMSHSWLLSSVQTTYWSSGRQSENWFISGTKDPVCLHVLCRKRWMTDDGQRGKTMSATHAGQIRLASCSTVAEAHSPRNATLTSSLDARCHGDRGRCGAWARFRVAAPVLYRLTSRARWLPCRPDSSGGDYIYNCDSTAIRLRDDCSTTDVSTAWRYGNSLVHSLGRLSWLNFQFLSAH